MGERTWANLLAALLRGEELSTSDTAWAMREIMAGFDDPPRARGVVDKGVLVTDFEGPLADCALRLVRLLSRVPRRGSRHQDREDRDDERGNDHLREPVTARRPDGQRPTLADRRRHPPGQPIDRRSESSCSIDWN